MRRALTITPVASRCSVSAAARGCSTTSSSPSPPSSLPPPPKKKKGPFDMIFNIDAPDEFLKGAAQAHSALGSLLLFSPKMWEPTFGIKEEDRKEFLTPTMLELLRQSPSARTLAAPDEHIMKARIVEVTADKRGVPLSTSDMAADPRPPSMSIADPANPSVPLAVPGVIEDAADQDEADAELGGLSLAARKRKARALVKDFSIRCTVELVVASPPERHTDPEVLRFYMARVEDADNQREKLTLARLLAISQTSTVFKVMDWCSQKFVKTKMGLYIEAIPLHVFKLPANFFQLPPTVRKTMTFELTPRLNWAVAMVTVDPSDLPFTEDNKESQVPPK